MGEWARKAQSLLEKKEETPGANEIKVKIELDTGDDDKDVVFVEKEDADKKRAPITVEEIFDLGSVRLRG